MSLRVAVVGLGAFGPQFAKLFKAHPGVEHVALCDLHEARRNKVATELGIDDTEPTLDAVCARDDIHAVAIYTQHWMHAPQACQVMRSGKHAATAVPPAFSIDEMRELVRTVEETGRTYMCMETSCFYPAVIWAREKFAEGAFGQMVYQEGQYWHDWHVGLEKVWAQRYGQGWEDKCGAEMPFTYSTHTMSAITSVTGAKPVAISSMGIELEDDPYFSKDRPHGNRIGNQVGMVRMSDGSVARISEFRRVGADAVSFSYMGTDGALLWPGYSWSDLKTRKGELEFPNYQERLPKALVEADNGGHEKSHAHLIHEFVTSILDNRLPLPNVWAAARFTLPGLVGIESARRDGELLEIPDLGDPPAH